MEKNYRSHLVGVFGCPVDENPTIVMQEAAFAAKGLPWRYLNLLVRPEDLEAAFAARGARTFDGLDMLVQQGAIGFRLWTGEDAPLEVMKAALERENASC